MIGRLLAGSLVVIGMALLLVGFTYNGGINQRGPLGIMGTVGTYVFPHSANRGLSIQGSSNEVGTSAAWYVTPAGAMTSGATTVSNLTVTGTQTGGRVSQLYFQGYNGVALTNGCMISGVERDLSIAAGNCSSAEMLRRSYLFTTAPVFERLQCSLFAATNGATADAGDQIEVYPYAFQNETTGGGTRGTCKATIDLSSQVTDSSEWNPSDAANCSSETSPLTGIQGIGLSVDITDADGDFTDLDFACTLEVSH